MGGGIRYPKEATKEELMNIIKPLFFPDGEVDDFIFDIATDVKGTQLMHDHESVALVMKHLKTTHFRFYLLAKAVDVNSDSSSDKGIPCMQKTKVRKNKSRNPVNETVQPEPSTYCALDADGGSSMADKCIPEERMDGARSSALEMQHVQEMGSGELIVINSGSDIPTSDSLQLIHGWDVGLPLLEYGLPLTDLASEELRGEFIIEDIIARSARDSGVIDFGLR